MDEINVLNILPSRILSFYTEAKMLRQGSMPYPRMAVLHVNYTCNHNCIGCDYHEFNTGLKATMSRDQAVRLVEQIVSMNIPAVEFAGGGEPTIDPNLDYLIDAFHANGIAMGMLTNGSMLEGPLLRKVVDRFSYVRISLEAGSSEIFKIVKGLRSTDEYFRVTDHVRQAIALRDELGSSIKINVKFTVGNENYLDMENGILLACELGADSIQFSLFENVSCKLTGYPAISINYILDSLRRKYSDRIRVLGSLIPTTIEKRCWLNPIFTVIDALGDVYMCTYYRHRRDRHCIGNIFEQSLSDIWFSSRHWEAIQNIDINECNVYNCRFHRYNAIMEMLLCNNRNDLDFI